MLMKIGTPILAAIVATAIAFSSFSGVYLT